MFPGFPYNSQLSYHLSKLGSSLDFWYFSLSNGKIPVVLKPPKTLDELKLSCQALDSKVWKLAIVSLEPHSTTYSFRSDSHLCFKGPKHVTSRGCKLSVTCGGYSTIVISSFLASLTRSIDISAICPSHIIRCLSFTSLTNCLNQSVKIPVVIRSFS